MFKLRLTSERKPRTKKGQPAQSTIGVVSNACSQFEVVGLRKRSVGTPTMGSMSSRKTGIPKASATQKRRVMSVSSESSSSSASVPGLGTSAIPHFGQIPGPICSTPSSIGQ